MSFFAYALAGNNGNGASTLALAIPAGALINDVLVATVCMDVTGDTTQTITGIPAGWAVFAGWTGTGDLGSGGTRTATYWTRLTANGAQTATWTFSASKVGYVAGGAYRNSTLTGVPIFSSHALGGSDNTTTFSHPGWTAEFSGLGLAFFPGRADAIRSYSGADWTLRTSPTDWAGNNGTLRTAGVAMTETTLTAGVFSGSPHISTSGTSSCRAGLWGLLSGVTTVAKSIAWSASIVSIVGTNPISFRGVSSGNNVLGGTSVALTLPAATQINDVAVAIVTADLSALPSQRVAPAGIPAGWTEFHPPVAAGNVIVSGYWLRAAVVGATTHTWGLAASGVARVDVTVYSGVTIATTPVVDLGGVGSDTGATVGTLPSWTTPFLGMPVTFFGARSDDPRTVTANSGFLRSAPGAWSGNDGGNHMVGAAITDTNQIAFAGTPTGSQTITLNGIADIKSFGAVLVFSAASPLHTAWSASIERAALPGNQSAWSASVVNKAATVAWSASVSRGLVGSKSIAWSASISGGFGVATEFEYVRVAGRYVVTSGTPLPQIISYVGSASADNSGTGLTVDLVLPNVLAANDLVFVTGAAFTPFSSGTFIGLPLNWVSAGAQPIGVAPNNLLMRHAWYRVVDPAVLTHTFTLGGAVPFTIAAAIYRGVHPTAPPIIFPTGFVNGAFRSMMPESTSAPFLGTPPGGRLVTSALATATKPLTWREQMGWAFRVGRSGGDANRQVAAMLADTGGPFNRGDPEPPGEALPLVIIGVDPVDPDWLIGLAWGLVPAPTGVVTRTIAWSASVSTTSVNTISRPIAWSASVATSPNLHVLSIAWSASITGAVQVDVTPPVISFVTASAITSASAMITWQTDEAADSQVQYGTTTGYGSTTTLSGTMLTSHAQAIAGLAGTTLYHYRVLSRDAAGNLATGTDQTFTTTATADTTAPVLSLVSSGTPTNAAATITWTTDEPADTQVEYGLTAGYGSSTTLATTLVTLHSQLVSGLAANTTYHYRVKSRDAAGNLATGSDQTLLTSATDSTPPVLSGVSAGSLLNARELIIWATDEPANAQVEYGLTTGYGSLTALDSSMSTSHAVTVLGLAPTTLYHYRVLSRDAAGNLAISGDGTFTSSAITDSTAPTVSGIVGVGTSSSTATIIWTTDEAADSQIEYGFNAPSYGSFSTLDTTLLTSHSVTLSGLNATTLYHYRILTSDAAGNLTITADQSFFTTATTDTTPPVVSAVAATSLSPTSEQIVWTTNEPADSQVEYGLTSAYGTQTTRNVTLVTSHSVTLVGLAANTVYHYRVLSRDGANNLATS